MLIYSTHFDFLYFQDSTVNQLYDKSNKIARIIVLEDFKGFCKELF